MIRKIALYGLLFSFGIAFGDLTQKQLEAFIETQGDSIEVKNTRLGFPIEITLKNEAAEEAWKLFLHSHTEPIRERSGISVAESNCFRKYSREASEREQVLGKRCGVKELRIIDFDSIVSGLDEEQKQEALRLKEDEAVLAEAIDKWANSSVETINTVKVNAEYCFYTLDPSSVKKVKSFLKKTLTQMSHYRSSRETLILTLVLLPDLKVAIRGFSTFVCDAIELYADELDDCNVQALYHELNHALHRKLGIEWQASMTGDLNSKLECDLFQFLDETSTVDTVFVQVTPDNYQTFFHESWSEDRPGVELQKLSKLTQLTSLWYALEEIWNIIGFANVEDCVYVNRMSDMNLIKDPLMFHLDGCAFRDCECEEGFDKFFKRIRKIVVMGIMDVVCPTPEAWEYWCQLQKRSWANFCWVGRDSVEVLSRSLRVGNFDVDI